MAKTSGELDESLEELRFLLKKDKQYFLKRLDLLNEILDELNYNLNISFILDRFVLEGSEK